MEKNRLKTGTLVAILVLAFTGCAVESDEVADERVANLQREVASLQEKLDNQSVKMGTEVAYLERQASLAAGCDYFLPLCPATITEVGLQAQAAGYGGGTSWPFWVALLGKLSGVGAFLGAFLGALLGAQGAVWAKWGQPNAEAVAQAAKVIATAEARADAAEVRARQAEEIETQAKARAVAYQAEATEIGKRVKAARAELAKAAKEIEAERAVREALTLFNS
jgi:hypothetical protein